VDIVDPEDALDIKEGVLGTNTDESLDWLHTGMVLAKMLLLAQLRLCLNNGYKIITNDWSSTLLVVSLV
jgi:hypothetical protein